MFRLKNYLLTETYNQVEVKNYLNNLMVFNRNIDVSLDIKVEGEICFLDFCFAFSKTRLISLSEAKMILFETELKKLFIRPDKGLAETIYSFDILVKESYFDGFCMEAFKNQLDTLFGVDFKVFVTKNINKINITISDSLGRPKSENSKFVEFMTRIIFNDSFISISDSANLERSLVRALDHPEYDSWTEEEVEKLEKFIK